MILWSSAALLIGDTVPDDAEGADGDLYLHLGTGDFYKKESGTWL